MPNKGLKILKYARFCRFVNLFSYLCMVKTNQYGKEDIVH